MTNPKYAIWSCDPTDIEPWAPEDIARLKEVLSQVFSWENKNEDNGQDDPKAEGSL